MSDIGHSRVLSKSQLFSFSAASGCVFAVGCHVLLLFNMLLLIYGDLHWLQRGVGENRPGEMQIYKFGFKEHEGLSPSNSRSE